MIIIGCSIGQKLQSPISTQSPGKPVDKFSDESLDFYFTETLRKLIQHKLN